MDAYDSIPYDSSAFSETHPENLAALAYLFGLDAPDPRRSSVLELGCATGGNLIPMAAHLPESEFWGIELSALQAEEAITKANRLNLGNVRVLQGDMANIDLGERRFDYVIAHGLYSWVPKPVRRRILEICRAHLNPQGLGYISYNTLPGWRMRGMLRDILLYHTRDNISPSERLDRAREVLTWLEYVLEGVDALSARYLREEIRHIGESHQSYLYHEYLTPINEPVLFEEFLTELHNHRLAFVCETELHTQFTTRISVRAGEALSRIQSASERAQYGDFLVNRNFRQSVICGAEHLPFPEPDLERLSGLAIAADLVPPKKGDLRRIKSEPYRVANGTTQPIIHPLTKAAIQLLTEVYPDTIEYPKLESLAQQRVLTAGGTKYHAEQTDHLFGELFTLFALRVVHATKNARTYPKPCMTTPRATVYARSEAHSGRVVGVHHINIEVDRVSGGLIEHMDGTRSIGELAELLDVMNTQDQPTLRKAVEKHPSTRVEALVHLLARHGLLTA